MRDKWLYPLGAGAASAGLWLLTVIAAIHPVGLLAGFLIPLPLFMVGLAGDARSVLIAGLIAGLVVLLLSYQPGTAALFLIIYPIPMAWLVLRYSQEGIFAHRTDRANLAGQLLVQLMTMAVAGLVVCSVLAVTLSGSSLQELGLRALEQARPFLQSYLSASDSVDEIPQAFDLFGLLWPGLLGLSWCWTLIINGLLARLALSRLGYTLPQGVDLRELRLPPGVLVIFIAAVVIGSGRGATGSLLGELGFILANVAVISSLGIFCAGLAAVHRFAARRVSLVDKRFVLFGFYAALILLSTLAVPVVIALGIVTLGLHWYRSLDGQRQD